ncbi:MAG: hypothetical protein ABIJ83_02095 [Patescibacteria group bacterium]
MGKITKLDDLEIEPLFNQYKNLVIDVFKVDYTLEFIKKYRNKRNNIFSEVTHVALENFYLLLLWKLFDKRGSVSVHGICNIIQNQEFKKFFDTEIKNIKHEIDAIDKWRNRVICHRDITVHFDPKSFEDKFKTRNKEQDIKKIKIFLFKFLCRFAPIANPNHTMPAKKVYEKIFDEIKERCLKEAKLSLQGFSEIYDPN